MLYFRELIYLELLRRNEKEENHETVHLLWYGHYLGLKFSVALTEEHCISLLR